MTHIVIFFAVFTHSALSASISLFAPQNRVTSGLGRNESSNVGDRTYPYHEKVRLLQDVLFATEKVLDFFAEDFSDINVDGLFGIRLAEGSIHGAIKECYNGHLTCPADLVDRVEKIILTIDYVSKKAEPYIEAQDPSYFHRFYDAIGDEYSLDYRPELLVEGRTVPKSHVNYDEERGDACLNLLSGTASEGDRLLPKCTITRDCWDFMTTPDLDDYTITHQLLYFIFIDKHGCLEEAREFDAERDVDVLRKQERTFCRNILGELRGEYQENYKNVDVMKQDLFLEQTLLCGVLGFEDFFTDDFIKMVLSWQYPSGCFSMSPKDFETKPLHNTAVYKVLTSLKKEAEDILSGPAPGGSQRKLMREVEMEGQCLAHKTGLAFGTLGAYLRYLMNVVYSTVPHAPVRLVARS